jgi:DNA-binding HxlR family transcriptional regulator
MPSNARIIASSSVTRALSVIGDRWTLLILRDAFQGAHRFEEFRNLSGAARSTLTSRLNGLVENGLLERVRYSEAPPRFEYRLTAMGLALYGVTLVTWRWEHNWAPSGAGIPRYLRHNLCKHAMQPETMCSGCGKLVDVRDTGYEVVAGTGRSRAATPRYRRLSR